MVRFILYQISSELDTNGNTYHACRVYSTSNRNNFLSFQCDCERSIHYALITAGVDPEEIITIESKVSKKELREIERNWPYFYEYSNKVVESSMPKIMAL